MSAISSGISLRSGCNRRGKRKSHGGTNAVDHFFCRYLLALRGCVQAVVKVLPEQVIAAFIAKASHRKTNHPENLGRKSNGHQEQNLNFYLYAVGRGLTFAGSRGTAQLRRGL